MTKKQKRTKDSRKGGSPLEPTRLAKLKKAWMKASDEERHVFLAQVQASRMLWPDRQEPRMIANGRYLFPSTISRIEGIIVRRGIRPETIAGEIGKSGEGHALTRALVRGASLRLSIVRALAVWLEEQEAPAHRLEE